MFRELKNSVARTRKKGKTERMERKSQGSEQRSRDLETSLVAERNTRVELEERLQRSEHRSRELETTLATVQQDFEEYRSSRESSCDWILAGNEIALSDKVIGEGAWGKVIEGTFGGCQVAVKKIHQLILSPHNRELFEREMNIASKCRHPCLLQFIGATNCNDNESPLFVTELLDTSLRALLQERALEPTEITAIALDVSKGLNYLHLKRPAPIIHRDISSANVLLWKRGSDWRAKVSDYGTANSLQQTMTVCPGAIIYSAPEAKTASRQSPKVDVYSFGVLLCEMNIRELPNIEERKRQVSRVRNGIYRTLIRRCLKQNPEERPSMAEIIQDIQELETSLAAERQALTETVERLQSSEQRSRDLETSLAAERQALTETVERLQSSEKRSSELETSLAAERQALAETERQLARSKQLLKEFEITLASTHYTLEEYRSSSESCNWILDRNEIALSDIVIGEGGLGKVIEGTFSGCKVAVKKIHQPILSPDDRDLFQREMSIAFRCRHPCLLEIIGATNDDESPLIVTELMDTNLRALLDERELEATEMKTFALDVANGLNYLHLRRPNPIIHGRISSANVLLWRQGSNGWRTKLSDYGTDNFLKQSKNVCPGANISSAPEARAQPSTQSPKTDVYSFGFLLFEMGIRELPNVVDRDKQIAKVKKHYRRIIKRCMRTKPEDRFDAMADIIEVMEKSQ